jgi:hypothetical protein
MMPDLPYPELLSQQEHILRQQRRLEEEARRHRNATQTPSANQKSLVEMWDALTPKERAHATREIAAGMREGGAT